MWRQLINKAGIQKVADGMGFTYMAIKKYTRENGSFPDPGKNMKSLVVTMFRLLPEGEFVQFMDSLSEDIMGTSSIMTNKQAQG